MEKTIAFYGFSIIEYVNGEKIRHFKRRPTVRLYSVCRCRIFDLMRSSRKENREFQIWDGINPISKLTFVKGHLVSEQDLLIPFYKDDRKNKLEEEAIWKEHMKPRIKNQKTGRTAGDMTSWIKKEAGEKVLATMGNKEAWIDSEPLFKRNLGEGKFKL